MKKVFSKITTLVLTLSLVMGVFAGITVHASGADSNGSGVARALSDEGIVLLKNKENALPLEKGANVAIFGEGQHLRLYTASDFDHDNSMGIETLQKQHGYIPWGAGSSRAMGVGGKAEAVDPLDAFNYAEKMGRITVYDAISQGYIDALENSNSDDSFVEYIPTQTDYEAAVASGVDTAIVVISRFDGECVDLPVAEWSLFESEKSVLQNATKYFDKVIVVLNTPTPIDTNWAFDNDLGIDVDAVLFAGYGGMQGGWAIADTVLGDVNPSGKLVTTYAKDLYDYPTTETFINDSSMQKYTEDIFLGYRYFETFDPTYSKVNYEFGFGLSYTTFDIKTSDFNVSDGTVTVKATVTNTGSVAGKEVVQMYLSAPQGVLGKAAKVLCAFDKTTLLEPGDSETLILTCDLDDLASFDDLGKTGNKSAYVLEAGDYKFYVGNSVKEAGTRLAGTHTLNELVLVEQLTQQAKTNLDKRLLADGTFENLSDENPSATPAPETEAKVHNIGTALRIEGEDWMEKPYSTNASYTGKTENFSGVLYNKITNTWDTLKGVTFSQAYMIKSVTYKVNAEKAGEYKISVRYASNANSSTPQISVQTSEDNVTFSESKSFTCIKTNELGGNAYNSYMDADEVAVTLSEGINYVKFNVSGAPNIDSFLIYYSEAGRPVVDGMIFEAEEYVDIVQDSTAKAFKFGTGWYYNGEEVSEYNNKVCVESMWRSGAYVTLKVNVTESGHYKMTARCSSDRASGLDILVSTDGTTFTNPQTLGNIVVPEATNTAMGKSGYYCFMDFEVEGSVFLKEGANYIKFAKGSASACNIDFFTLEETYPTETIESEEYISIITKATTIIDYNKTGKLYNEETDTWDSYTCTNLANGWQLTEATYQIYVEQAGEYTFDAIAASNKTNTGKVNLASDFDNFTKKAIATVTDTKTGSGSDYYGYKKVTATDTFTLKKGLNVLKLTFSGAAPNVDKFIIKRVGDTPVKPLKDVVSGAITLDEFVEQMTVYELATFFVSYPGLNFGGSDEVNAKYGFSRITVSDGPSGIGSKGTSFPCETIIACTWNTDLVEAFGRVMGKELYDNDIEVWLAPGVNLHRNPLAGRNSEYYSEDPFISGIMATTTIKAVQRYGVSVCIKHFVCNEKEQNKLSCDSRVSERALREIYLKPFEMAVKDGKAQGIMSSYNLVNGVAMNENKDILTNILRGEWNFEYYISGDWNNNKDMVKEINAGHGVREPYSYCDIDIIFKAIDEGRILRETLLTGAKYELNTLMMGKRNYSKWTSEICKGSHTYVNDVCSKCHAPDSTVFTNLDKTVAELVDNMAKTVGLKMSVLESTIGSESGTIVQGNFTNKINTLNADKTRAELTVYNTMASKADLKIKMGIYVADTKWTRVVGDDNQYSYSGDDGIYRSGGWLVVPYGCTATLWYDLSDSKYDTFEGSNGTYLRNQYNSIIYISAPECQASDNLYLKGENLSCSTTQVNGMTVEKVNTDIVYNNLGEYNVQMRLVGDYGAILDEKLLTDAGLKATNGEFFDGKVDADYILKATDNENYIFKGWYDEEHNLISTEKLVAYDTLSIPAGKHNLYAYYVIKNAKQAENTIKGATLDIGSSLTVNYFADLDEEHTDAILSVTRENKTVEINGVYDENTGMYKFAYTDVNPQCMVDNIKAELIFNDEVISEKDNYSVKTYADNLAKKTANELNMSDEKYNALITLLSDMLVYGKEAQDYQEYKQSEYATDGISWLNASEFTVPMDGIKNVVSGNTDANNRVEASGVYVGNVNKIYFRVNITDGVTVLVDGKEATPDTDNKVYTADIFATGFSTPHTVELIKDGNTVSKFEYNVNAYVQSKHDSDSISTIVKAISNYGASAKAFASVK